MGLARGAPRASSGRRDGCAEGRNGAGGEAEVGLRNSTFQLWYDPTQTDASTWWT